ncbi:hypothetical protein PJ985_07045 [Streptomyces sp. ACA25]|uniref:divisome protein SepX/GlpR n=1 Tax=Streptomyces sp. ACA25 TaxID=3022596 RepID=UPI0023071314|nr:hypothetical protein [Streptomyces sp. ACA25]MDB1087320.1 hypothetical protein [Streptomyces sp. ACA25]
MSSSGLIFAMIVGAWAAYLVPMWLRRQDELNDARPTERFSTAIRLLSGRAAMERRYAKDAERRAKRAEEAAGDRETLDTATVLTVDDGEPDVADVRSFAEPVTEATPRRPPMESSTAAGRNKRAKVLARRRRTTMVLFLAFASGGIFTAAAGPSFLWVPAVPAVLLSAYIMHLRKQERRRYAVTMDRRRAEEAARRLRERTQHTPVGEWAEGTGREEWAGSGDRDAWAGPDRDTGPDRGAVVVAAEPVPTPTEDRKALVEQTDHAEWVDQQRRRTAPPGEGPEGWDPAPVPLPTYVTAPVAPRSSRGVDLDGPDAWSAARSTPAGTPQSPVPAQQQSSQDPSARGPQRTPLFDQFAEDDRPRAAGE